MPSAVGIQTHTQSYKSYLQLQEPRLLAMAVKTPPPQPCLPIPGQTGKLFICLGQKNYVKISRANTVIKFKLFGPETCNVFRVTAQRVAKIIIKTKDFKSKLSTGI
jgi:hypothetical protein